MIVFFCCFFLHIFEPTTVQSVVQDKRRRALEILAEGSDPHAETTLNTCREEMAEIKVAVWEVKFER